MKEVITKFLLIIVAVAAVTGFVYGTLWEDTQSIKDRIHQEIQNVSYPEVSGSS